MCHFAVLSVPPVPSFLKNALKSLAESSPENIIARLCELNISNFHPNPSVGKTICPLLAQEERPTLPLFAIRPSVTAELSGKSAEIRHRWRRRCERFFRASPESSRNKNAIIETPPQPPEPPTRRTVDRVIRRGRT